MTWGMTPLEDHCCDPRSRDWPLIAVAAKELFVLETFRETPRSQADRHTATSGGADRPGQERYRGEDRSVTTSRPGACVGPREVTPDRASRIAEIRRQIADGT